MDQNIVKKLHYKQGRAIVVNAPDGYALGIDTETELQGEFEFVQLFVNNAKEVEERVPMVIPSLKEDAVFWITYPKQSSKIKTDINRDRLWKIVSEISEYRPVSNVAIDETWSALRFRHQDKVKSKK